MLKRFYGRIPEWLCARCSQKQVQTGGFFDPKDDRLICADCGEKQIDRDLAEGFWENVDPQYLREADLLRFQTEPKAFPPLKVKQLPAWSQMMERKPKNLLDLIREDK